MKGRNNWIATSYLQLHEQDAELRSKCCLSFEGFARYLMDKRNYVFVPETLKPQEDVSLDLLIKPPFYNYVSNSTAYTICMHLKIQRWLRIKWNKISHITLFLLYCTRITYFCTAIGFYIVLRIYFYTYYLSFIFQLTHKPYVHPCYSTKCVNFNICKEFSFHIFKRFWIFW